MAAEEHHVRRGVAVIDVVTLTKPEARRFLLAHQGLWPPRALRGKAGVLSYIRRVGCIQFDPLNIVGHNPDLVLQARVSDFRPAMLRELLYQDRRLLDGWDKMMAIYPVQDWPCFSRQREAARRRLDGRARPVADILPHVRQAIEERGPLSSLDLDYDQPVDWPWAPTRLARAALESMYLWGELVIHHKVHTRRVYDFAWRHLPESLLAAPDPNESEDRHQDWRVLRRIGGVGLLWSRSGDAWLGMEEVKREEREAALARLLDRGEALEVRVEGIGRPLYMRSEDRDGLTGALGSAPPPQAAILAPLDNLLWDRRLARELFDFDYRWEVYKPPTERRYGYYVLPILYGDRFVARFEAEKDRRGRAVTIKGWWWEAGVSRPDSLTEALRDCFVRFLGYLEADRLQVETGLRGRSGLGWLELTRES